MMEQEALQIPAGMIQPGDTFFLKGQFHAVKRIEPLTQCLIRIHSNVMSFDSSLVVDSRLVFPAVMRTVPNEETK
jgi:hypothetical protein